MNHVHAHHDHKHGAGCGHTAIKHEGHVDYLHDGHLHHVEKDGTVTEHAIPVSKHNPEGCHPLNAHTGHTGHHHDHKHGPNCGHEAIPHGNHTDYLVNGRLHHVLTTPDGKVHCDDHGPVEVVKNS